MAMTIEQKILLYKDALKAAEQKKSYMIDLRLICLYYGM